MQNLHIVTLNCWGVFTPFCCEKRHERLDAVARCLSTGEHDIICLQEIWTDSDFEKIEKQMSNEYPYSHYFHSNVIGSGCCIFSKHQILDTFFHPFSLNGYAQRIYHGDWFGGKGVGMARIQYHGFILNIYVTHFHAEYSKDNDEYRPHRVCQAYEMARFVRLTSGGADAVIAVGDFNLHPNSLGMRTFRAFSGLHDAWLEQEDVPDDPERTGTTCGRPDNCFTSAKERQMYPIGQRLDYVLFGANAGTDIFCKKCSLELRQIPDADFSFSDHEGVGAVIQLKRAVTAANTSIDGEACRGLKKELREELAAGYEKLRTDRFFYAGATLIVLSLIYILTNISCCLATVISVLASIYLIFALWTLIVVKTAERRSFENIQLQLSFDHEQPKERK